MNNVLNFDSMPENTSTRNVEIGTNHMIIKEAEVVKTSNDKKAIMFTLNVKGHDRPNIKEWCTCFDKDGNIEPFGQYKLSKILKAIDVIPEGNFGLSVLPTLVKGKEFIAVLKYQNDEEKYLEIAHPDADGNYLPVPKKDQGVEVKQAPETGQTAGKPSEEVQTALENDDIL